MKKFILSAMIGLSTAFIITGCGDSGAPKIDGNKAIINSEVKVKNISLEEFLNTTVYSTGLQMGVERNGKSLYPPAGQPDSEMLKVLDKKAKFTVQSGATAKDLATAISEAYGVNAKFKGNKIVIEL